jgi:hypothetical protein
MAQKRSALGTNMYCPKDKKGYGIVSYIFIMAGRRIRGWSMQGGGLNDETRKVIRAQVRKG